MVSPPSPSAILVGAGISLGFATAALVLRLISRVRFVGAIVAEDAFLVAALALSACHVSAVAYQVRFGLGTDIATVDPEHLVLFLKALFFSILFYVTGHTLTKISILWLYTGVFRTTAMRKIYPIMLVAVAIHGLWLILSGIFGCIPIQGFWDHTLPSNCLPRKPMWFSNAAANILTDFALFLSPLLVLKTSSLPRKQKIGLYVVFLLGFFVCFMSIIRFYYLYIGANVANITQDIAGVAMWSAVELNVAIICACLMVMKPLVAHLFPRLFLERLDTAESHHFSYIPPPTISERCTAVQQQFPKPMTASHPSPPGVSSEMDLSTEEIQYKRDSVDCVPVV